MKRLPIAGLLAVLLLGGCKTVDTNWLPKMPWSSKVKESKYEPPRRMAAIWSADVLTQVGQPPVRGFGGRFYFYNAENQPIPVEGQLIVYAYDDTKPVATQNRQPDRKFAFTPEQFTEHYSASTLGASYSIWIPWDEAGGDQKNISLLPVFTSASGQVVMGQQALNVLPGKQTELARKRFAPRAPIANAPTSQPAADIQPAGHYQSSMPEGLPPETRPRMNTTTIELPSSMQKRLAAAAPTDPVPPASTGVYGPSTSAGNPAPGYPPTPTGNPAATGYSPALAPATGWAPTSSQPAHSAPRTLPAPTGPGDQSGRAAFGWRRHPAAPQFAHPSSPQRPQPTQAQEYGGYAAPTVR